MDFRIGEYTRYSTRGVVASTQLAASQVGVDILNGGGNAFDASVAVSAALQVLLPTSCGPGGDFVGLIYEKARDRILCIDAIGKVPLDFRIGKARKFGKGDLLPLDMMLSSTVPSCFRGLEHLHKGYCRLPLAELLGPAIRYARNGIAVSDQLHFWLRQLKGILFKGGLDRIFMVGGEVAAVGSRVFQPGLGDTFERVAREGFQSFFEGDFAGRLVKVSAEHGGIISKEDLAGAVSRELDPLASTFRGHSIFECPPPCHGLSLLQVLAVHERMNKGLSEDAAIHNQVEAFKLAFSERVRSINSGVATASAQLLLGSAAIGRMADKIGPEADNHWNEKLLGDGDTTSFAVIDESGNCACFTQSLSLGFGNGKFDPETGVIFNNRLARSCLLDEGGNLAPIPGASPLVTLSSFMMRDPQSGGMLAGSSPGGDGQPQFTFQFLLNYLENGLSLQAAANAPRWVTYPGTEVHLIGKPPTLSFEEGYSPAAVEGLKRRGHVTRRVPRGGLKGALQLVGSDGGAGFRMGASDFREEGGVAIQ